VSNHEKAFEHAMYAGRGPPCLALAFTSVIWKPPEILVFGLHEGLRRPCADSAVMYLEDLASAKGLSMG